MRIRVHAFKSVLFSALLATAAVSPILIASQAHAAGKTRKASSPDAITQFREASVSIPNALMSAGYNSFGSMQLADLVQKSQTVPINPINSLHRAQIVGDQEMERSSAQWSRENGSAIQLNQVMWKSTPPEQKKVLALHENLGAAGYDDKDYLMSTGMWLLTRPESSKLTDSERAGVTERITAAAGGGVTGIGGGGDIFGLTVKMNMLLHSIERISKSSSEERADAVNSLYADFYMGSEIHRNSYLGLGADGHYHVMSN